MHPALVASSFTSQLELDAPVASGSAPRNGAVTGGATVTISGIHFGAADGTPSVTLGGAGCRSSSWSSATSITCLSTPPSASADMLVALGDAQASAVPFSLDAPSLSHVEPPNLPCIGGATLSLSGLGFGSAVAGASNPAAIVLGGIDCAAARWLSTTAAACSTPLLPDATGQTVGLAVGAAELAAMRLDRVVVSAASPANVPRAAAGADVTLSGLNFARGVSVDQASLPGLTCQTSRWISSTAAACLIARPPPVAAGPVAPASEWLSFDAPVVSAVLPLNGPKAGAAAATVVGANFGADATVHIGGTRCARSDWASASSVRCVTAAGDGEGHAVVVDGRAPFFFLEVCGARRRRIAEAPNRRRAPRRRASPAPLQWPTSHPPAAQSALDVGTPLESAPRSGRDGAGTRGMAYWYEFLHRYRCTDFGACSASCTPSSPSAAVPSRERTCLCVDQAY